LASILRTPVQELGYQACLLTTGTKELVYDILRYMKTQNVNAIPLVDEKSELIGCFSASDLKALPLNNWPRLFQDVSSFLQEKHPDSLKPVYVTPTCTFQKVLEKMEQFKVHRVFVVDNSHDVLKPVGVITTTDIMRWIEKVTQNKTDK